MTLYLESYSTSINDNNLHLQE